MEKLKIVLATGLGAFLALFALQDMAPVQLTVLFWTFEGRRIIVIGISFLAGFAIGWTAHTIRRQRSPKPDESSGPAIGKK